MKTSVLKTLSAKQAESVSGGLLNFTVNGNSSTGQSIGYVGLGLIGIGRLAI
jgi:hypothetical protein